jgi:glucokinase
VSSAAANRTVLGIDVGATKMAAAVIDSVGEILATERTAIAGLATAEALFEALERLCRRVVDASGARVDAVGVGCSGPMRYPDGIVSPINIPVWREFPLRARLQTAFELPCCVDNDAKALALGERWRGAGHGSDNMLGMVVSTGVGGGIILDGRLLDGFAGNAGHVGHIIVWPNGPACGCGARGCVEGIASGSGLTRRLNASISTGRATSLQSEATAAQIADAARDGDELAVELFRTAGEAVGRGVASAAALLDLELVVIGGSIALHAWDLLGPPLLTELRRSAQLDFTRNVRIVRAQLGDQAGLFGAAQLALNLR